MQGTWLWLMIGNSSRFDICQQERWSSFDCNQDNSIETRRSLLSSVPT